MTLVVHRLGIIAPPLTQNKTPDGGLGVAGALPRRWLRVKQVAWRRDGGLLVRFLAVGCGLNKSPGGGMGVCWCASSPLAAG